VLCILLRFYKAGKERFAKLTRVIFAVGFCLPQAEDPGTII